MVRGQTASASSRERHRADLGAALARRDQRPDQAGVLLVGGDDLVARPDVHPRQHLPEPLAGGGGQRDVVGAAAEQLGVARAQLGLELEAPLEVGVRAALVHLRADLPRDGLLRRPRDRPVRAGVEVRDALEDRELSAQRVNGHGGAG